MIHLFRDKTLYTNRNSKTKVVSYNCSNTVVGGYLPFCDRYFFQAAPAKFDSVFTLFVVLTFKLRLPSVLQNCFSVECKILTSGMPIEINQRDKHKVTTVIEVSLNLKC